MKKKNEENKETIQFVPSISNEEIQQAVNESARQGMQTVGIISMI